MVGRLAAFVTYNTLAREIRNNPETEAMSKVGLHSLVNTLYALSPENAEYERNDKYGNGELRWHTRLMHATFNGGTLEDTRPMARRSSAEYMVLTDSEAEDRWGQDLRDYCEEHVLAEIPASSRAFFNIAAWVENAKTDGRGHSLSGYDGQEHTATDPETKEEFYVYRTN
jgi:hypothetical protein